MIFAHWAGGEALVRMKEHFGVAAGSQESILEVDPHVHWSKAGVGVRCFWLSLDRVFVLDLMRLRRGILWRCLGCETGFRLDGDVVLLLLLGFGLLFRFGDFRLVRGAISRLGLVAH